MAAERIASLHSRKRSPQPGDWLASHAEPGQTFDEYCQSVPNRPGGPLTTIYIQPLGTFSPSHERIVAATADLLQRFYGPPVLRLEPRSLVDLPADARRVHPTWGEEQILTSYLLQHVLKPKRPPDAVAVLGLVASDLWPGEGWNFVFGQALLGERVGVWSLYRYGDPDAGEGQYAKCLRRTLKVAVHETGHMLGMLHCTAFECGMNGSNHRAELDLRPLAFCPECVPKVWWSCKVDPLERFRRLIQFAETHHLDADARLWQDSLDLLAGN